MTRTLYHMPLSAASRIARLALAEKRLEAVLRHEDVSARRNEFLALNPAGEVPVLVDEDETVVPDPRVIGEYLEEAYPDPPLLGLDIAARMETRRLVAWFDGKFAAEVTDALVGEKVMKRLFREGAPSAQAIRAGLTNIHTHLDYISYLAERRRWLAGEYFSLADIAAAAHLSVVDYIGDVPWADHPEARLWYARVKSRPSFRPFLADRVPGLPPVAHYDDLDF